MSFIFGGGTGSSYDDLIMKRKRLDALQQANNAAVSNPYQQISRGINRLGNAFFQSRNDAKIAEQEAAQDAALQSDFAALNTPALAGKMRAGMQGPPMPPEMVEQNRADVMNSIMTNPALQRNKNANSVFQQMMRNKFASEQPMTPYQKAQLENQAMGYQLQADKLGADQEFRRDQLDAMNNYRQNQLDFQNKQLEASLGQKQTTNSIKEYEYAASMGYDGTYQDFIKDTKKGMTVNVGGGLNDPSVLGVGSIPSGNVLVRDENNELTLKPIKGNEKFTEGDQKTLGYLTRAETANQALSKLGEQLSSPYNVYSKNIPAVGKFLTSDKFKTADAAGMEFLTAILRKDTGAAISDDEKKTYGELYLEQVGDGEQVKKYRAEARMRALEGLKRGLSPQALLRLEENRIQRDYSKSNQDYMQQPNNLVTGGDSIPMQRLDAGEAVNPIADPQIQNKQINQIEKDLKSMTDEELEALL